MRSLGIRGVVRGTRLITTRPDTSQPCPDDKVNRLFKADRPNKLWVSDFTYVPTWSGTVYVAFAIDVFATRIVGWRASTSMKTQFVLDALEQAIWQRKTPDNKRLVHHSDRGSQYLSIKYTERLASAEIDLSVGTVGYAYDNALAECVIHSGAYAAPLGPRSPPYVQNRGHQPDRPVEIDARSRVGNLEMGRLSRFLENGSV